MEVVKDRIQSYVINEVLDLSGLELYEFPEIPWHISRVNLSNNFISNVSQIPKTIKSLDLSRNGIKDISFEEKSKLIFLNLRENCLEVLDVKNIEKLRNLDVSYNELSEIQNIKELTHLMSLNISYNKFSTFDIPNYLYNFQCNNNILTNFNTLPDNIEYFNCSNNQIVTLPEIPTGINRLIVSNNPILELNIKILYKIITLDCSNTKIKDLPKLSRDIKFLSIESEVSDDTRIIKRELFTINTEVINEGYFDTGYFDILGTCFDYTENKDVFVKDFMISRDTILIKVFDDFFGVKRSSLLELGNKREHIHKDEDNNLYIDAFIKKYIPIEEFKTLFDFEYDVYVLSRSHHFTDFIGEIVEERINSEIMHLHKYKLNEYILNYF